MIQRTNTAFAAAVACLAVVVCGAARAATPVVTIEQSSLGERPVALLNDGQVVLESSQYGPCQGSPSPFGCTRPLLSRQLSVASASSSVKTPGSISAPDFLGKRYLVNNLGKIVSWPNVNARVSEVMTLDTQGSQPRAFASEAFEDNSPAGCKINDQAYNWVALSNGGQLLGQITNASCAGSLVVWSGTALKSLPALPSGYERAGFTDLNATGKLAVTGNWVATSSGLATRAMLWDGAKYQILPLPLLSALVGYSASAARVINDAGDVAGDLFKRDGSRHAVVWSAGKATDIGTLSGYKNSLVVGLNSKGLVLACAYNKIDDLGASPSNSALTPQLFMWDKGTRKVWSTTSTHFLNADGASNLLPFANCAKFFNDGQAGHLLSNQKAQWLFSAVPGETTYLVSQP